MCEFVADDNKAHWGISAIRKTKKPSGPKVFGIRLEDCQPAVNHKVMLHIKIYLSIYFSFKS